MERIRVEEVLIYTNDQGWRNHYCDCIPTAKLFKIDKDMNYIYATCIICKKEHHLNTAVIQTPSYELKT